MFSMFGQTRAVASWQGGGGSGPLNFWLYENYGKFFLVGNFFLQNAKFGTENPEIEKIRVKIEI